MNSRATAAVLGVEPNGSARASEVYHVPLIRMSNTFFMPGETRAGENSSREVEHGYYVCGQPDSVDRGIARELPHLGAPRLRDRARTPWPALSLGQRDGGFEALLHERRRGRQRSAPDRDPELRQGAADAGEADVERRADPALARASERRMMRPVAELKSFAREAAATVERDPRGRAIRDLLRERRRAYRAPQLHLRYSVPRRGRAEIARALRGFRSASSCGAIPTRSGARRRPATSAPTRSAAHWRGRIARRSSIRTSKGFPLSREGSRAWP